MYLCGNLGNTCTSVVTWAIPLSRVEASQAADKALVLVEFKQRQMAAALNRARAVQGHTPQPQLVGELGFTL